MDHDAKILSARLDVLPPFRIEHDAIDVTNATVPDSRDDVGETCMATMGKMGVDKVDDNDDPDDDDDSDDDFDCSSCSNERRDNRPVAMAWADFKSTQTMVPSWHIAKRMERDDVVVFIGLVDGVLIVLDTVDTVVVVATAADVVEDIDGMGQIVVIPQTETNFGFVATAGEPTTRL
jgi:hypothetical protein